MSYLEVSGELGSYGGSCKGGGGGGVGSLSVGS